MRTCFSGAVEILDYYHAHEYLVEIADGAVYVRPLPASDSVRLDWITQGRLTEAAVRKALECCRS